MVKMQLSGDRRARMKDGEMEEPFLALPEAAELQGSTAISTKRSQRCLCDYDKPLGCREHTEAPVENIVSSAFCLSTPLQCS